MTDIVIDLETMGRSKRAAIVAIGAVALGDYPLHNSSFYRQIDLESSMGWGSEIDGATVKWWLSQGEKARQEIASVPHDVRTELDTVLLAFCDWLAQFPEPHTVWGYGASFDLAILVESYRTIGMNPPWHYRDERDLRTIVALTGVERPTLPDDEVHNALSDARNQCEWLQRAMKHLHAVTA